MENGATLPRHFRDTSETAAAACVRQVARMQRHALWVRDFFVYKDMYNPDGPGRRDLLRRGRSGHDGFLMLAKALETKARALGKQIPQTHVAWLAE